MISKPTAIVLGGTCPHIELVKNLQQRGYHSILVDYLPNPPAKTVADEHVQESTLDKEKVLQIAKERSASLVISTCLDQPIPIVAEVSEELGLPCYLKPKTARAVTNKLEMKRIFAEYQIPTARWTTVSEQKQAGIESLRFPVITKQVAGTGSLGLAVIQEKKHFADLVQRTFEATADSNILVEEFSHGRELSVDAIVIEGNSHTLLVRERHTLFTQDGQAIQCHGTVAPADIDDSQKQMITTLTQRIAEAFSLVNSPLMIQLILMENNNICVLEIAARLGGGISGIAIPQIIGFDLLNAAVSCYLSVPIAVTTSAIDDCFALTFVYASDGIIDQFVGFEGLIEDGLVKTLYFLRKKGDVLPKQISAKNRIAEMIIDASSRSELKHKAQDVFRRIDIRSNDNCSLMLRSLAIHHTL